MIGEIEKQARVLDRVTPGWWERINPEALSCKGNGPSRYSLIHDCVLGQVYGCWGNNPAVVNHRSPAYLGFGFFWKARWVACANRRRKKSLSAINTLDLRRFDYLLTKEEGNEPGNNCAAFASRRGSMDRGGATGSG